MLKILIPTDFSKNASNAIRYILKFTKNIDCKLYFFHGGILPMPIGEVPLVANMLDPVETIGRMKKNVLKIAADGNITIEEKKLSFLVEESFSLPPMIQKKAAEIKADLIVMGTKGASGIKKAFIGSNTVDIISSSIIPVLAIPENFSFSGVKKILLPSDLSNFQSEFRDALLFAKLFDAKLEVLFFSDATDNSMKKYNTASKQIHKNSYEKVTLVIEGIKYGQTIAKDIENYAKKNKPDILMMFRHEHNWLGNLFLTSQTDKLAFTSRIPLLALREPK